MNERKIIHIDMDAFFASVEQRDKQSRMETTLPHIRMKPLLTMAMTMTMAVDDDYDYDC